MDDYIQIKMRAAWLWFLDTKFADMYSYQTTSWKYSKALQIVTSHIILQF